MMRFLLFVTCVVTARIATAQAATPDRQFWVDYLPAWHVTAQSTDELELSFRTAWQGAAPTQYWATDTFEWNATPWLGLDAVGAMVESRGPSHGGGFFEARVAGGARFTWRGQRLRASEYVRVEHRMVRPLGATPLSIDRLRHREQVIVAVNHPSLNDAHTAYLLADAEWFFVHDGRGGWAGNQLRARAGLGYRINARHSLECILNDTQHRDAPAPRFEDSDHILRLRWREAF